MNSQCCLGKCPPSFLGNDRSSSPVLEAHSLHRDLHGSRCPGLPAPGAAHEVLGLSPCMRLVTAQQGAGHKAICRSPQPPLGL